MGKTRDLFKKITDVKGTLNAKMCTIKDKTSMDQQKKNILRRGDKNIWKNYTKKSQITMVV